MKIVLFLIFFVQSLSAQFLDFYKEDISFKITGKKFYVNGVYFFKNNQPIRIHKRIFFPVNQECPDTAPDSVIVLNVLHMDTIPIFDTTKKGFFFTLDMAAMDSALLQVKYQRDVCCDSLKYILTSTKKWGKPLISSTYKLTIPDSIAINYFSYRPDKKYDFGDFYVYTWHKTNFFPEKDMVFKFKTD